MENRKKGKVFVGLSGGVDSAVSAALLKDAGYDVTGVFIKVWQPDFLPCNWREERRDAMRVALALEIPFVFLDFEDDYKKGVVDNLLSEYRHGRTPNPDVLCNREIKFGSFWKKAREMGADYIATGHYAQIMNSSNEGVFKLIEGGDKEKDQSYFLWTLTQEDLSHSLFPVGHLEKEDVRKLAQKYKLPVASKKDSQGICFLGDISMEEFLSHFIDSKPGNVLNTEGKIIGKHKGALFYTIGERRGFEISKKTPESGPFYVVSKDMKDNTITVTDSLSDIESSSPKGVSLSKINWIEEPDESGILARIRYRQKKFPVELTLTGKKLSVKFKESQKGIAMGQSIVFYRDEECLGGAVLDKALDNL